MLEAHSRDERGTRLTKIRVRDRALSVSSSVGKVSVIDGERVSHVVDPRTGTTVPGAVEAVVVGERAGEVDAWSTALLVLGAISFLNIPLQFLPDGFEQRRITVRADLRDASAAEAERLEANELETQLKGATT